MTTKLCEDQPSLRSLASQLLGLLPPQLNFGRLRREEAATLWVLSKQGCPQKRGGKFWRLLKNNMKRGCLKMIFRAPELHGVPPLGNNTPKRFVKSARRLLTSESKPHAGVDDSSLWRLRRPQPPQAQTRSLYNSELMFNKASSLIQLAFWCTFGYGSMKSPWHPLPCHISTAAAALTSSWRFGSCRSNCEAPSRCCSWKTW